MVVHGETDNKPKDRLNFEMELILLIGLSILMFVLVIGISLDYFITDPLRTHLVEQVVGYMATESRRLVMKRCLFYKTTVTCCYLHHEYRHIH